MSEPSLRSKGIAILASTLILSLLLLTSLAHGQLNNSLQVSYIDVGQGDSIWLHGSDGTDILIDGGPRAAGPTVVAYLQDGSVDDIEVVVLSHGDADHVGGLIDVLRSAIPVDAGETLRIWAMAEDAGQGGYNCGFGGNIWNNDEPDPAALYNNAGQLVARYP